MVYYRDSIARTLIGLGAKENVPLFVSLLHILLDLWNDEIIWEHL